MTEQVPAYIVKRTQPRKARNCLVIPVINESQRIGRLLTRVSRLGISEQLDVVVVDGGSSDGSLGDALLDACGVHTLLVKTGPGKLSAQLRCAYHFVLGAGYDGIVTIDGNNKDDPAAIPAFVEALDQGFDFVQGSRFVPGGIAINTPLLRWAAIRLVHAPLLAFASGFGWTDTTQGFRGYSRVMLSDPRVDIFRDVFADYELLAYLSYRAPKLGFRCLEVPTSRTYPASGKIPIKISPFVGNFKLLETLLKACTGRYDPKERR